MTTTKYRVNIREYYQLGHVVSYNRMLHVNGVYNNAGVSPFVFGMCSADPAVPATRLYIRYLGRLRYQPLPYRKVVLQYPRRCCEY
jgi:hypothetical protein